MSDPARLPSSPHWPARKGSVSALAVWAARRGATAASAGTTRRSSGERVERRMDRRARGGTTRNVRERAARLRAAGATQRAAWLAAQIGREVRVLIEREGIGHSENFAPVRLLATPSPAPGDLVVARITGVAEGMLTAQPIDMGQT